MGSGYFGFPNMGKDQKSSSSSSSSRKNKKSSSSDKPKQPQRGLGVAQLEQIRLRSQLACGFNNPSVIQEDVRVQGVIPPYGVPQSSTSYPFSQSSPSTSSSFSHHPNFMMAFGEERVNSRFQDHSHPSTALRWSPNCTDVVDHTIYAPPNVASRQLSTYFEDTRHQRIDLMRSSSQNSESSNHEDVDLELRLSL